MTVSGIEGVTFRSSTDVERVSNTEVTVELAFNGNIDTDGTLIFTVGADAIANYNGPALTAEIPVTAVTESVVASVPQPLTEAALNGSVVTLTLSGGAYERSIFDIGYAVTVSGIEGVTVGRKEPPKQDLPDGVCRVGQVVKSGEKCTYPGTSNDFWVDSAGRGHFIFFTAGNAIDARGTTINGVVYNFLARHQGGGSWIIEAAGGTAGTFGIERVSDTEVTVELAFNGNIDTDGTLIFTVGADAIAGYNGSVLTAEIPVTAVEKATPDFDGDGRVGFADFLQFAAHFGLSQGDEGYDARYDLDGDGAIGFGDFLIFANDFGKDLPATRVRQAGGGGESEGAGVGETPGADRVGTQREVIPAKRDRWERERVAWQRAEERAHWARLQRGRGKGWGRVGESEQAAGVVGALRASRAAAGATG